MKFDKYFPTGRLRPYIHYFVVSENEQQSEYTVFPASGLVIGFQYKGRLSVVRDKASVQLASAGVTGISDRYSIFSNSAGTGTVLVYFTEIGFAHFTAVPVNELFNLSLSLDELFEKTALAEAEEKLASAATDTERVKAVEDFLESQMQDVPADRLVAEAVRLMEQSKGTIRVSELNDRLSISQSPFEKRFRRVVGTSPKKFASIIRFNAILEQLKGTKPLSEIGYELDFFDQAHFIRSFKQVTGISPEKFKRQG